MSRFNLAGFGARCALVVLGLVGGGHRAPAQNDAVIALHWTVPYQPTAALYLNIFVPDDTIQGPFLAGVRPSKLAPNHSNSKLEDWAGSKTIKAPTGLEFWVGFYYDLDGKRYLASKAFKAQNNTVIKVTKDDFQEIGSPKDK